MWPRKQVLYVLFYCSISEFSSCDILYIEIHTTHVSVLSGEMALSSFKGENKLNGHLYHALR